MDHSLEQFQKRKKLAAVLIFTVSQLTVRRTEVRNMTDIVKL